MQPLAPSRNRKSAPSPLPGVLHRRYGERMTRKWRGDLLTAQQVGLPRDVGLLLGAAILSAVLLPSPYGFVLGAVALALTGTLLYRNLRRRRRGIDGWTTTLILAPYVFMTSVVLLGTFVSESAAAVFAVAIVVGGLVLLVRRLRRSAEPERSAHHFRGAAPTDGS